jgi:hypothetical protein
VATEIQRFVVRRDGRGYSVIDSWTGESAVIALAPQTGMPQEDAEHLAVLLNQRAAAGDRRTAS